LYESTAIRTANYLEDLHFYFSFSIKTPKDKKNFKTPKDKKNFKTTKDTKNFKTPKDKKKLKNTKKTQNVYIFAIFYEPMRSGT
jgi:hypothetical protein